MPGCSIKGCKSRHNSLIHQDAITFHQFPTDPKMRERWVKCTGRDNWQPTRYSRICSKHFDRTAFIRMKHRTMLDPDSMPEIGIHISNTQKDVVRQSKTLKSVIVLLPELPPTLSQSSRSGVKSEPREAEDDHTYAERADSISNTQKDVVRQSKTLDSVTVLLPELQPTISQSSRSSVKSEPREAEDDHTYAERADSISNTQKDVVRQSKTLESVTVWLPELPPSISQSSRSSVKSEPREAEDDHTYAERADSIAADSDSDTNSAVSDSVLLSPASVVSEHSQRSESIEIKNEENIIEAPNDQTQEPLLMVPTTNTNVTTCPSEYFPIQNKTRREKQLEKMLNREMIKSERRGCKIKALRMRNRRLLKKTAKLQNIIADLQGRMRNNTKGSLFIEINPLFQ